MGGAARRSSAQQVKLLAVKLIRLLVLALSAAQFVSAADVTLLLVGPATADSSSGAGIEQGVREANQQGRFLGLEYKLVRVDKPAAAGAHAAAAAFVVGSPDDILAVADALATTPVFNIASHDDALRTACRPNLFHTAPSDKMLADAVAQWKKESDAADVVAQAWHESFVKFAGRELNNRFRKAWNTPMDDASWAAWVAVKILSDALANNPEASGADLISYFREEMEFDGQKGAYMTFRATGQLGQTLLIVENGKLAGEAPVRGVAASDDLDSLGMQSCAQ